MQTLILSGNLCSDCEIFTGKDEKEYLRFTVAANDFTAGKEEKATYYSCRMRKTGVADRLLKGTHVFLTGSLKISQNAKDGKEYTNLDVWVSNIDVAVTPAK